MTHKTNCIDCKKLIEITLSDTEMSDAKEVGLNPMVWLDSLVCQRCEYKRENGGKAPPYKPKTSDWLIG
jgi:hypothetical protein